MTALRQPVAVIGRASELGSLSSFLDALDDSPAALVLDGEAGIGKTALWAWGVRQAEERGHTVLSCRATQAEAPLPFVVLGDLFEHVPEQVLAALSEPRRRALEVAMLRAEWNGPAIERRAVGLAVLDVLEKLAEEATVVVAVDDLQWLDAASAASLQFALRRLDSHRVGLLATHRGGGELAHAELVQHPRRRRLEIGPLDRESLGQLLLERLRMPLSPPALLQLYRVSGGNPFFALEIGRALERREVRLAPGISFALPGTLRELVRDRLTDLAPSAQDVALVVAALSQPTVVRVEAGVLAAGVEGDAFGQALTAGIVEVEGTHVRFTHPLLGSIVYSEASPARRRELHAALATVTDGEERARHLALATTAPDDEVAASLDEAATSALRRGAPEAAAELFGHGVRLTPDDDSEGRWRRTFAAADCHLKAGDAKTARSLLTGLSEEALPGPVRARALVRLAGVLALEDDWQAMGDLCARALRETDEAGIKASCENGLAWMEWFRGDLRAAVPHIRASVSLAEQAGEPTALAEVLGEQAFLEGMRGERRTDALLERALSIAEPAASVRMLRQPQRWCTPLRMWADELERAREISYAEYRKALELGDEHVLANVLDGLTDVERLTGNWDEASRFADEMHRAALLTRQELLRAIALSKQGFALALRGQVDAARARAEEGLALAEHLGFLQPRLGCLHVLGFLEMSLENHDAAHRHLGAAVAAAERAGLGEPGVVRFVPDEVETLALLGEAKAAESLLTRFEERAAALERRWALGSAARCRALFRDAEEGQSTRLIAQAEAWHEEVGQPFELARTLLVRGQIQRRAKQKAAARVTLERARTTFDELGAPLWAGRAARELARIGGRSRRTSGLTETEQRVAELAADGLTNREIAAALFLSPNTVQAYLKRVYRELGVRSRTELARKVLSHVPSKSTGSGVSVSERPS